MNELTTLKSSLNWVPQPRTRLDESNLTAIGALRDWRRTEHGVVLRGADASEIAITVVAPDVVRVRAAWQNAVPAKDHSWAIAPHSWHEAEWQFDGETLSTDEILLEVQPNPLRFVWRRKDTGAVFMRDHHPLRFGPEGAPLAATLKLGLDDHFYGLGEKAARLDHRRGSYTMWNTDTPGYVEGTDPIYQSIPFYLCLDAAQHGQACGIFFDNSYRSGFDFGRYSQEAVQFWAEGGEMNYYVLWGPDIPKILGRYAQLTGHMPMYPKWALGNQQSRYSYYPAEVLEGVVARYRKEDLPLDVVHLDIHYMNG
ncbi:MAG: TIM-barrel domain-containing protein, partial [Candidatus Xenobia bacterium]